MILKIFLGFMRLDERKDKGIQWQKAKGGEIYKYVLSNVINRNTILKMMEEFKYLYL